MPSREYSTPHPTPEHWISNARLVHYQFLLRNPAHIKYHPASALSLATLPPNLDLDIKHDCSIMLSHVQNLRPDLTDIPRLDGEMIFFTERNSFRQG